MLLAENGWTDVFVDFDPEPGIAAGQRWLDALQKAAYRCEVVLALVSKESLDSGWCRSEVKTARLLVGTCFLPAAAWSMPHSRSPRNRARRP
jgi:TIR domain